MAGIPDDTLSKYREDFMMEPKNRLAQNVCTQHDLLSVCLKRQTITESSHTFNHKIPKEVLNVSNQKASGRCWIFACLNAMRIDFMTKYDLSQFEFSQNYLFFWDKLERCNYLLDVFGSCARDGEKPSGRLLSHLLYSPAEDGGQWDMLVNLIEKYGVVPKSCFPESHSSSNSRGLGGLLRTKMREFCQNIQTLVSNGTDDAELRKQKDAMLKTIYNILCVTLGTPPTSIVWEYQKNSDKQFVRIGPMSPVDFYKTHVKPQYDVSNKICIVNDPRPHNPYGQLYTVNYLNNMSRGQPVLYVNQPVEVLKNLAMTAIQRDEAVWFGCDVGKHFYGKAGILDVNMLDHELVFGTDLNGLEKSDRLIYGDSLMTHAMLFTGVNIENGKSTKWRVENSWGDEDADKGYLLMTDEWFSEFVYEVVIDKKYISSEILEILQQDPTVLPAWDPMGSLA